MGTTAGTTAIRGVIGELRRVARERDMLIPITRDDRVHMHAELFRHGSTNLLLDVQRNLGNANVYIESVIRRVMGEHGIVFPRLHLERAFVQRIRAIVADEPHGFGVLVNQTLTPDDVVVIKGVYSLLELDPPAFVKRGASKKLIEYGKLLASAADPKSEAVKTHPGALVLKDRLVQFRRLMDGYQFSFSKRPKESDEAFQTRKALMVKHRTRAMCDAALILRSCCYDGAPEPSKLPALVPLRAGTGQFVLEVSNKSFVKLVSNLVPSHAPAEYQAQFVDVFSDNFFPIGTRLDAKTSNIMDPVAVVRAGGDYTQLSKAMKLVGDSAAFGTVGLELVFHDNIAHLAAVHLGIQIRDDDGARAARRKQAEIGAVLAPCDTLQS